MDDINYTFKIDRVKAQTFRQHDNFITNVYWTLVGKDSESITGTFRGATSLIDGVELDETYDFNDFVDFSEFTEEMLIEWVEAIADLDHAKSRINDEISAHYINQKDITDLPWISSSES